MEEGVGPGEVALKSCMLTNCQGTFSMRASQRLLRVGAAVVVASKPMKASTRDMAGVANILVDLG